MNESLSRISSILESAKDLTVEAASAAATVTANKLAEVTTLPSDLPPRDVIKLLESNFDSEILQGLKSVISYMCIDKDAEKFFPYVIKNINNNSNLKIKKLIYIYLLRFTEINSDTVLLSINSIQKSLSDYNPEIRALSIRIISSIDNISILPICLAAIKNATNDLSAVVRRAAAVAISKIMIIINKHSSDVSSDVTKELINEHLNKLLGDSSTIVLNSAIITYNNICPENYTILHQYFRYFCLKLNDLDEWTQSVLINILAKYCRLYLSKPKIINLANLDEKMELPSKEFEISYPVYEVEFDKDLKLFFDSISTSVYSQNESLILASIKASIFLAPSKTLKSLRINDALIHQLSKSKDESTKLIFLQVILYIIMKKDVLIFQNYYKTFFLYPSDLFSIAKLKLNILSLIIDDNNSKDITKELKFYIMNSIDYKVANEAVKTLGKCSQINLALNKKILSWLLNKIDVICDSRIIDECLSVIRYLIQQSPENNIKSIIKLGELITYSGITLMPESKSAIIWLVGEFISLIPKYIADFTRNLLINFKNEENHLMRLTILLLICKYYIYDLLKFKSDHVEEYEDNEWLDYYPKNKDNFVYNCYQYVMQLCRYDNNYDIRDQARLYSTLFDNGSIELLTLVLQAIKPVPVLLLTNQPILNNMQGSPVDITKNKNNEENQESIEISPQPSNENSFSERFINNNEEQKFLKKIVSNNSNINSKKIPSEEEIHTTLIDSALINYFSDIPKWSSSDDIPNVSIRDAVIKSEKNQSYASSIKSLSSSVSCLSVGKKMRY